ncbi:hypothetical protein DL764_005990 [Monosporascus ibericus]|uniref:Uncharacterized protein n=1 Tax=Monosporascus ibericus TaxID=155417 RepID=A0A4Q4T8H3_9PEZI|nr:hypothetical protein DL764_005990 [Monosporascus ibericus]
MRQAETWSGCDKEDVLECDTTAGLPVKSGRALGLDIYSLVQLGSILLWKKEGSDPEREASAKVSPKLTSGCLEEHVPKHETFLFTDMIMELLGAGTTWKPTEAHVHGRRSEGVKRQGHWFFEKEGSKLQVMEADALQSSCESQSESTFPLASHMRFTNRMLIEVKLPS